MQDATRGSRSELAPNFPVIPGRCRAHSRSAASAAALRPAPSCSRGPGLTSACTPPSGPTVLFLLLVLCLFFSGMHNPSTSYELWQLCPQPPQECSPGVDPLQGLPTQTAVRVAHAQAPCFRPGPAEPGQVSATQVQGEARAGRRSQCDPLPEVSGSATSRLSRLDEERHS